MDKTYSTLYRLPCVVLLIAVYIVGGGIIDKAHAQDVNGIFFPRSSEEFFRAGVERLDDKIINLERTHADAGDRESILDIDASVSTQQDELERRYPWLIEGDCIPESFDDDDDRLHAI